MNSLHEAPKNLPRILGLTSVIGIVVGTMIGSGIFIVPASVAAEVRAPTLIFVVWIVGGVLTFFGALSLSELGAAFPQAGGIYVFLREAYGRPVAFLFGWSLFLLIDAGTVATLSVAFSTKYLPHFFQLSFIESKAVAILLITFLVTVNYIGVRWGASLQNFLTVVKFGALFSVCTLVFLFAKGNPSHFISPSTQSLSSGLLGNFGVALVATLWAYKGWETVTFSAGELRNPTRNLPLGTFVGTLTVIFLYLAANLAYLYAFPSDVVAKSSRIASEVMNFAIGPLGASVIAFIILFSITGAANGHYMTGPRVYFAMARDGLFFKKLAEIHPRFLTPHFSILALGVWSALLSLTGTFEQLFMFVVFVQWIFMGLAVGAVIILRKRRPELPRPYKTWGYPLTPIFFALSALYISVNTLINEFLRSLIGLVIISLGIPAYLYWKRKKEKKEKGIPL